MLLCFEQGMDLQRRIENADEAHQNHEACGEKVHDKFQGVLQHKGTHERFDSKYKKKERKNSDQDIFPPPEVQIRSPYLPKII
jgi:hypothetical protein